MEFHTTRTAKGYAEESRVYTAVGHLTGRQDLKPSVFYRIASGLLVLFAIGHTLGFRQTDPQWGVDALVASMRTIRFDVQGFSRTYWDFYVGAGLFVSIFLLFTAIVAWQLGNLSQPTLRLMPVVTWALAFLFAGLTVLSWIYLFIIPVIFSAVVSLCLIAAAGLAGKQDRRKA